MVLSSSHHQPSLLPKFISLLPAHSLLVIDLSEDLRSLTTEACPLLKHPLSLASREFPSDSSQKITFRQKPNALGLHRKNESLSGHTVRIIVRKCSCQQSVGLMCSKSVTVTRQALQLHLFKGDKLVSLTNISGLATVE